MTSLINHIFSLGQFAMSVLLFLSMLVWSIANYIVGNFSFVGILTVLLIATLLWRLVCLTWADYLQDKKENQDK